jgi:precorrin-2/cobalt-factor-2 C20-methyltransferase
MSVGTFFTVGIGPGDPELMTLKAARIIGAAQVVAYFAKAGRPGHACGIAAAWIGEAAEILRFEYPFTTEVPVGSPRYGVEMAEFYDRCGDALAERLGAGRDVVVLCEGDPFFYGSSMYLFDRLSARFPSEVVPGVTGMSGCWARARLPMTHGDDMLTVLPGTLDEAALATRLAGDDAVVVMKVGRNIGKVRAALRFAGRAADAVCVVRGTMDGERIVPIEELGETPVPYFTLVLVPGRRAAR